MRKKYLIRLAALAVCLALLPGCTKPTPAPPAAETPPVSVEPETPPTPTQQPVLLQIEEVEQEEYAAPESGLGMLTPIKEDPPATPAPGKREKVDPAKLADVYMKNWGSFFTDPDAKRKQLLEACKYCTETKESDFTHINSDLPEPLYHHVYNFFATQDTGSFQSNQEYIADRGEEMAEYTMKLASAWYQIKMTCLPGLDEETEYLDHVSCNTPEEEARVIAKEKIEMVSKYDLTRLSMFVTDISMVYISCDGQIRVRGRAMWCVKKANAKYFADHPEDVLGEWYATDMEVCFAEDEDGLFVPTGTVEIMPWLQAGGDDNPRYIQNFEATL